MPSNHVGHLIHEAVLTDLKSVFPNQLPPPHTTSEDLHVLIGEQKVIAYLARLYSEANALTSPTI